MTMEKNTYTTSNFIAAPQEAVTAYAADGASLTEYTLFSRMKERIDETTWLGTASGYQAGLYYHVVRRNLGPIQIVEWHCGAEFGIYHHVYPMLTIAPSYFASTEVGTYYHWISFVDPARATAMITQGLPTVHRSEARSMKSNIERRHGHRAPVVAACTLEAHTIFVDAPMNDVTSFLADPANVDTWGYLMRREGAQLFDDYDNAIDIKLTQHDLGAYQLIEHDTHFIDGRAAVRTPMLVIPTAYAFGQPAARGAVLHRLSAWPVGARRSHGKASPDDYNTESINAKRIIEARAGNLGAYAKGCSYLPAVSA